ncbi:MAG: polymerase PolC-type [Pseudomonadota bacterium]|jgi:DNA polymerase-3 subunit epsilon
MTTAGIGFWARLANAVRRPPSRVDESRWIVLDVESSGLDMHSDRLLAIAAIGVRFDSPAPRIDLGDSFEVLLRQSDQEAVIDKNNILLHGIGVGMQRSGTVAPDALRAFARYVGDSPLIAFHAAFDRTLIERAFKTHLGLRLPNPWLDLEPLAAVLNPAVKARALDEWMAHFNIHCAVRHQAAADTLATAELLLKLWPEARRQMSPPSFQAANHLAAQRRWIQK